LFNTRATFERYFEIVERLPSSEGGGAADDDDGGADEGGGAEGCDRDPDPNSVPPPAAASPGAPPSVPAFAFVAS
jgi:hypothetical protein